MTSRVVATASSICLSAALASSSFAANRDEVQPRLGSRAAPILEVAGLRFRDLDRDGRLTHYEDWRLSPDERAADLVARMTLEEKAGAMMHPVMENAEQVSKRHINSMLTRSNKPPAALAVENNAIQEAAEATRLGIPVTISTDPRNGFEATFGMSVNANGFSQWPDSTGLGAARDAGLVKRYGAIVAEEYRAVGITMALSPQADVATDPRWSRVSGTFGEDPKQVGKLAAAYIEGIQGGSGGVTPTGVAAVVKHFAGYGATKDGWDSHTHYGRFATFPGGRLDDHVAAFRPSFKAHVAGVMPTYSILETPGLPPVAGAFNKVLLRDILRKREGYQGLVVSDWSVTEDCNGPCMGQPMAAGTRDGLVGKPWGVETLSRSERVVSAVEAGIDQIGGAEDSGPIVDAARSGRLPMARVDEAVRKIMRIKFALGLFEDPYADPAAVQTVLGREASARAALQAQERSLVLLENKGQLLPLRASGKRIYLKGISPAAAQAAGFTVVDSAAKADVALIRVAAPWQQPHRNYVFGSLQHEGDLDFKADSPDLKLIQDTARQIPTIVTVYLERPAILTNVRDAAGALIGNFGASDRALLDLVTGRVRPTGRLPFELPSSMAAAAAQKSDVPHDSKAPLYPIGFGLKYRP
jgi:beta-glucosidase